MVDHRRIDRGRRTVRRVVGPVVSALALGDDLWRPNGQIAGARRLTAASVERIDSDRFQIIDRSTEPTIVDATLDAHDHLEQLVVAAEDPRRDGEPTPHRSATPPATATAPTRTFRPATVRPVDPRPARRARYPARSLRPGHRTLTRQIRRTTKDTTTHDQCQRTTPTIFVAIVIAALALAGCTGQARQPDNYGSANTDGEGFYGNFMFGCTGVTPVDGEYQDTTLESQPFCRCVYDGMKETVPFAEAKAFDEAQATAEPGTEISVPPNIAAIQERCGTE